MKISKKILVAFLLLTLAVSNISATGIPVFDIESWVSNILQQNTAIQSLKSSIESLLNAKKEFDTIYKSVSEGNLNSLISSSQKIGKDLEDITESWAEVAEYSEQLNDKINNADWSSLIGDPFGARSMAAEYSDIYNGIKNNWNDMTENMQADAEDSASEAEDRADQAAEAAQSQSVSEQNAQLIKQNEELLAALQKSQQQNALLTNQLQILETAESEAEKAEAIAMLIDTINKNAEWSEENDVEIDENYSNWGE